VLEDLVKRLNALKALSPEKEQEFKAVLDDLIGFIKRNVEEKRLSLEDVYEYLAGFIVERCDNLLANISSSDGRIRDAVAEMAASAYKMYLNSVLKRAMKERGVFVEYMLTVKAPSLDDLLKAVEDIPRSRENLERYVEVIPNKNASALLSNLIIESVEDLEEHIDIIRQALNKGLIKLAILPREGGSPLFFKRYYYVGSTDEDKVRKVAAALRRIVERIISEPELVPDKDYMLYLMEIKESLDRILGKSLLEYMDFLQLKHTG
jgi:hypothetical protein